MHVVMTSDEYAMRSATIAARARECAACQGSMAADTALRRFADRLEVDEKAYVREALAKTAAGAVSPETQALANAAFVEGRGQRRRGQR